MGTGPAGAGPWRDGTEGDRPIRRPNACRPGPTRGSARSPPLPPPAAPARAAIAPTRLAAWTPRVAPGRSRTGGCVPALAPGTPGAGRSPAAGEMARVAERVDGESGGCPGRDRGIGPHGPSPRPFGPTDPRTASAAGPSRSPQIGRGSSGDPRFSGRSTRERPGRRGPAKGAGPPDGGRGAEAEATRPSASAPGTARHAGDAAIEGGDGTAFATIAGRAANAAPGAGPGGSGRSRPAAQAFGRAPLPVGNPLPAADGARLARCGVRPGASRANAPAVSDAAARDRRAAPPHRRRPRPPAGPGRSPHSPLRSPAGCGCERRAAGRECRCRSPRTAARHG